MKFCSRKILSFRSDVNSYGDYSSIVRCDVVRRLGTKIAGSRIRSSVSLNNKVRHATTVVASTLQLSFQGPSIILILSFTIFQHTFHNSLPHQNLVKSYTHISLQSGHSLDNSTICTSSTTDPATRPTEHKTYTRTVHNPIRVIPTSTVRVLKILTIVTILTAF
jgi:hypothetical protein